MKSVRTAIGFETRGEIEFFDLTERVRAAVTASGIREGTVAVVSKHTTGGIAVNERDPALELDMITWLKKTFPAKAGYEHNAAPIDFRLNAHAHLAGLVLRASETLVVADGEPALGPWQAVFFVECDGPRPREVAVVVTGEP